MDQTRVVDANGNPALCYRCGKAAISFINTSVNMASSVPLHMEPVCAEHDPYKLGDMTMVRRQTWDDTQAEVKRLRAALQQIALSEFQDAHAIVAREALSSGLPTPS